MELKFNINGNEFVSGIARELPALNYLQEQDAAAKSTVLSATSYC